MARSKSEIMAFVTDTIDQLIAHQSARLGGQPDGPLFLTTSNRFWRTYRSVSQEKIGEAHRSYLFPGIPLDEHPRRVDLHLWPLLDQLSNLTGEARYRRMVDEMADAFAAHGFDPRSGLGYLSEEADFDVVDLRPVPRGTHHTPKFKGGNTLEVPGLPLERLWRHAPRQMARMFKAAFYGLVANPERLDYNRFCYYDFDDRDKKPSLKPDSSYLGFSSSGARLIHWWASAYVHTGDGEFLTWAQRMADKWRAVQHPQSGLLPEFFGGGYGDGQTQLPAPYSNIGDSSISAASYFQAAAELDQRSEGAALARQLREMATRLQRGVATFAYDFSEHIFRAHLHMDGRIFESTARYTFHTEADREEAAKHDPLLREVPVWRGVGLYRPAFHWSHCAGTELVRFFAESAELSGDAALLARTQELVPLIMEEAAELTGPLTSEGRWSFHASAQYIRALLILHRLTGNAEYLAHAHTLADMEMRHLSQPHEPQWWRLNERNSLLYALLDLAQAE